MKIKVIALSLCMMATSLTLVQGQNNKSDVTWPMPSREANGLTRITAWFTALVIDTALNGSG